MTLLLQQIAYRQMKKKIIIAIGIFSGLVLSFGGVGEQAFASHTTTGICKGGWDHELIVMNQSRESYCLSYGACFRKNFQNGLSDSFEQMTSTGGSTESSCTNSGTCWYGNLGRYPFLTDMAKLSCEGKGTPDWPSTGAVWYQNRFKQNIWVSACADVNQIDPISGVSLIDHFTVCRPTMGCTNTSAINYNSSADTDNGSCIYRVYGCTNRSATNYNSLANTDDGSCRYGVINFCGDVNDPSVNNSQTLAQCSAANPNKTCVRKDELCEYNPAGTCGDPMACNFSGTESCNLAGCEYNFTLAYTVTPAEDEYVASSKSFLALAKDAVYNLIADLIYQRDGQVINSDNTNINNILPLNVKEVTGGIALKIIFGAKPGDGAQMTVDGNVMGVPLFGVDTHVTGVRDGLSKLGKAFSEKWGKVFKKRAKGTIGTPVPSCSNQK